MNTSAARRGGSLTATAAAAALLLVMGGCATQTPAGQAAAGQTQSRFERIVPPPGAMFGPYGLQYAQKYRGAAAQGATAQGTGAASSTQHQTPPAPVSPFSDNPVSFLIRGQFIRGEHVIVRVCLHADHSIASSSIVESSGDARFDELAITWAQRVRLRQQQPADARPVAPCGAVRVELHEAPEPAVIAGHDDELG